ncbi:MAG: thiamine ABC transporter substrate-binding protein [Bdellovibrionaceae bacterium]|nr:thiamine ABC transporter substrate-binding protein [Pseudobdellovibrionaceae bacterium]|tara:strand:+ start:643 stop:1665 length:1023 start_codon:yes stop_codon:yes gene_type:complete
MEKGKLVVLLIFSVVLVGALVFLKWALDGRNLPRESLIEPQVKILSYSTFVSATGPAPQLVAEFESRCNCKVEFYTAGDAGLLLERLKLSQDKAGYDVVIGFDQFSAAKALQDWTWLPILNPGENPFVDVIGANTLSPLVPFDYSPMTFIYRSEEVPTPPQSLNELLGAEYKSSLSLQDPRSSSPGLQFLSWVSEHPHPVEFLKKLKPNVHSVSPSWALSYGLFKKNQSRFVFSYVTSLVYHRVIEQQPQYDALNFSEGHPVQVEYAGVPSGCRNCELGKNFARFLLEKNSQFQIAEKNFMYPSVKEVSLPPGFDQLPQLKLNPVHFKMPSFEIWDRAFE